MGVDVAVLTETKLTTTEFYTRDSFGYTVEATRALSSKRGGVALVWRNTSDRFHLESTRTHGPNCISSVLVTGLRRYLVIGLYLSPSEHLEELDRSLANIVQATNRCTSLPRLILGDPNYDPGNPARDPRSVQVAAAFSEVGVSDLLSQFQPRRKYFRGHTWRQVRDGTPVSSRTDCFLTEGRQDFQSCRLVNPRYFDSDHLMIVGKLFLAPERQHRRYLSERRKPTLRRTVSTLPDHAFEKLVKKVAPPEGRSRARTAWISKETWDLVDQRAQGRRAGTLVGGQLRELNRLIRKSFKADRKNRAQKAGEAVEAALRDNHVREAWSRLKSWYRCASGRAPKPTRADLLEVSQEYKELYTQVESPGAPLELVVEPFDIDDHVPTAAEVKWAVRTLRSGRAPGPSGMRAEDLKGWLEDAEREENPNPGPWTQLMAIVQEAFISASIPDALTIGCLVLIPKDGEPGKHRGIGLLEVVWKVIAKIINKRLLAKIQFHPSVHGFRPKRSTGTAILECKLLMDMAQRSGKPLSQIFLDFAKAYPSLDRSRTLPILEGYGVGPRTVRPVSYTHLTLPTIYPV